MEVEGHGLEESIGLVMDWGGQWVRLGGPVLLLVVPGWVDRVIGPLLGQGMIGLEGSIGLVVGGNWTRLGGAIGQGSMWRPHPERCCAPSWSWTGSWARCTCCWPPSTSLPCTASSLPSAPLVRACSRVWGGQRLGSPSSGRAAGLSPSPPFLCLLLPDPRCWRPAGEAQQEPPAGL